MLFWSFTSLLLFLLRAGAAVLLGLGRRRQQPAAAAPVPYVIVALARPSYDREVFFVLSLDWSNPMYCRTSKGLSPSRVGLPCRRPRRAKEHFIPRLFGVA